MYQVSIFNNNIETIIHYPSADAETPHLPNLSLKESISQAEVLSFTIYPNNVGYDLIEGLVTKVKVVDIRNNSVVFIGRVIPVESDMNSTGLFYKNVVCESSMAYLNDSNTRRWNLQDQTATQILTKLLDEHNVRVDDSRKIYLGFVYTDQRITVNTNYETTLNTIITKIRNVLGGDLRVVEKNGKLYLDFLAQIGENNGVEIKLGYNMQDLNVKYDPCDVVTRIVPLGYGEGINQLTINSANGGNDSLNSASGQAKYGVIEACPTNLDIQSAITLKIWGETLLKEISQMPFSLTTNMLDLSVLAEHEGEKYELGDTIKITNVVMKIDIIARVMERTRDLIVSSWSPSLVINTRSNSQSDQITDLKQRSFSLETAPQGSTFITCYNANDNLDNEHSIKIPIWLSPDIIYVNRVALHIESQKFRAYEKGVSAGGASTQTSSGGGASTSSNSGASGGGSVQSATSSGGGSGTYGASSSAIGGSVPAVTDYALATANVSHTHNLTGIASALANHTHLVNIGIPNHTHGVTINIPAHSHGVSVDIPNHTHNVEIPNHVHEMQYGIFEDSYNEGSKILINGTVVADAPNGGSSLDIDISKWIEKAGENYILEITSSCRGRISVQVNVQAFIQSK